MGEEKAEQCVCEDKLAILYFVLIVTQRIRRKNEQYQSRIRKLTSSHRVNIHRTDA